MKLKDKPAFPCTTGSDGGIFQPGATLRELYAGLALTALCSNLPGLRFNSILDDPKRAGVEADVAVIFADALIAKLEKEGGGE